MSDGEVGVVGQVEDVACEIVATVFILVAGASIGALRRCGESTISQIECLATETRVTAVCRSPDGSSIDTGLVANFVGHGIR